MASSGQSHSAIKIFARIKPVLGQAATTYEINTSLKDEEILTVTALRPSDENRYVNNKQEVFNFRYARVFDTVTKQEQIFEEVARPVIDSGLQGYNGTIFAYGQTGSGKTFTMTGSNLVYAHRGLTPRTLEYIFSKFEEDQEVHRINSVAVSYLEIYNDTGYDLLHMSDFNGHNLEDSKVSILEDGNAHIHFRNLSVHPVQTLAESFQMLMIGDRNRTIAETPLNDASTRSHCIFTIHLNVRDADSALVKRSKINLVDLAGSERIANSCVSGHLLVEARHINLALHYLEQVIVALSERNRDHIPYRNSMMTQLLRDSLGGNCLTAMIATLSMERKNLQETLSTNRFAQRVALVTNAPVPNEEVDPTLVISHLKAEIRRLKETIAASSIKILNENETAQPLAAEEKRECESLVEEFVLDHEPSAILPVKPDMRLIQECFRLLKSQVGKPRNSQMAKIYGNTKLADETAMAQLVARREAEIKVLVSMLKKEKTKNYPSTSSEDLIRDAKAHRSMGRASLTSSSGELSDDHNKSLRENDFEEVRPQTKPRSKPQPGSSLKKAQNEPLSTIKSVGTIAPRVSSDTDEESKVATAKMPPKSSLYSIEKASITNSLTGLKQRAMASFMSTYAGTPALDRVRARLLKRKEEILSLEATIESQRNNLIALRELMTSASDPGPMYEAYQSQQRTSDMQKERLRQANEDVVELEADLKIKFRSLLDSFEGWWKENQQAYIELDTNQNWVARADGDGSDSASSSSSPLTMAGNELQVETKEPILPIRNGAPKTASRSTSPKHSLAPLNAKVKTPVVSPSSKRTVPRIRLQESSPGSGSRSRMTSTSRGSSASITTKLAQNKNKTPPASGRKFSTAETTSKKLSLSKQLHQAYGIMRPAKELISPIGIRPAPKVPPVTPATGRSTVAAGSGNADANSPDADVEHKCKSSASKEDDAWIKNLPLTGHPGTDKEIVKYFKPRRRLLNTRTKSQTKLLNGSTSKSR